MKKNYLLLIFTLTFLLLFFTMPSACFADWSENFDGTSGLTWTLSNSFVDVGDTSSASIVGEAYELRGSTLTPLVPNAVTGEDPLSDDFKWVMPYMDSQEETDAIIQGKIHPLSPGAGLDVCLGLRQDPTNISGYGGGILWTGAQGIVWIGETVNGIGEPLKWTELPYNTSTTDSWLKFAAVGGKLFAKAWAVGTNEPVHWQIELEDDTRTSGYSSIASLTWYFNTGFLASSQASFDDITLNNTDFTDFWIDTPISSGAEIPAGGTVTVTAGTTESEVVVESSATEDAVISVAEISEPPLNDDVGLFKTELLGKTINVDSNLLDGEHQTVVKLHYTDAELTASGINDELELRLYYWDIDSNSWRLAVSGNTTGGASWKGDSAPTSILGDHGVDTANNILWAVVDHFTTFGAGDTGDGGWALQDANTMIEGDDSQPETTVALTAGANYIWVADTPVSWETVYADASWGGQLQFSTNTVAFPAADTFTVDVGSYDGVGTYTWGPSGTLSGNGTAIIDIDTGADGALTIQAGQFLAVRATNNSANAYTLLTGGLRSWVNSTSITIPSFGTDVLYIPSDTTDGNTIFTDTSPSAHPVTANGNVQHATSGDDTAIAFDGGGDYLSLPDSDDWDFGTGEFSIDMWVNFDGTPANYDGIFGASPAGAPGYFMRIYRGKIQWKSDALTLRSGFAPTPGQWHHLAVVRSGDVLSIYVDGVERTNAGCAGKLFNSAGTGLVIGRSYTGSAINYFDGTMDEITVTKGTARWTGNFTPPNVPEVDADNDGLSYEDEVGVYGTDPNNADTDGDGISDNDEINSVSGYATDPTLADTDSDGISDADEINGTYADPTDPTEADTDTDGVDDGTEIDAGTDPTDAGDFPTVPAAANLYIRSSTTNGSTAFADLSTSRHPVAANGNVYHATSGDNTAIDFDGTGDYLSLPDSDDWDFGADDFTIDLWVNFNGKPANYDGIFGASPAGVPGYFMRIYRGKIQWKSDALTLRSGFAPTPGQWHHLAVVRSGDVLSIYVDGVERTNAGCAGKLFNSAGTGLVIGRSYTKSAINYFDGLMDEITVTKGTAKWTEDFTAALPNDNGEVTFSILQTSDVHHHASGYGPFLDYSSNSINDDSVTGGYARLATVINDVRDEQTGNGNPVFLFDSGDYLMGTPYDLAAGITGVDIALDFFQRMNYTAITLGNHEFDWTPNGLGNMIYGTMGSDGSGFTVPILASNMVPDGGDADDDLIEYLMATPNPLYALGAYPPGSGPGTVAPAIVLPAIVPEKVITLSNGNRIGLLGLLGPGGQQDAPLHPPLAFNTESFFPGSGVYEWDYGVIQDMVDALKNTGAHAGDLDDPVNMVIVLSHSGITPDGFGGYVGDDIDLAEWVTGIDIIASGHAHTATHAEVIVTDANATNAWDTLIFSPGEYGEWLSRMDVTFDPQTSTITNIDFNLLPVNDATSGDATIQAVVNGNNAAINAYLSGLGLALEAPISHTTFDLTQVPVDPFSRINSLGSLCADAVRFTATNYGAGGPCAVSVVAKGVIRDDILETQLPAMAGIIPFSDIYSALPLGISPNTGNPGYPIMETDLTPFEIYLIAELGLTASMGPGYGSFYLNFSGLKIEYDITQAGTFQGVQSVSLYDPADIFCQGPVTPLNRADDITLIHCSIDLYGLQLLGVVNQLLAGTIGPYPGPFDDPPFPPLPGIFRPGRTNYIEPQNSAPLWDGGFPNDIPEYRALMEFLGFFYPDEPNTVDPLIYGPGGSILDRITPPPPPAP